MRLNGYVIECKRGHSWRSDGGTGGQLPGDLGHKADVCHGCAGYQVRSTPSASSVEVGGGGELAAPEPGGLGLAGRARGEAQADGFIWDEDDRGRGLVGRPEFGERGAGAGVHRLYVEVVREAR